MYLTILKRVVRWTMVLLLASTLVACDLLGVDDNGDSSSGGDGPRGTGLLMYQDTTDELTQLWFDNYGSTGSAYNIDLLIATDNIDFQNETGTGRFVYLEMFFPTNAVTAGTYAFATTEVAGTFSDFSDISTVVNGNVTWDDLTAGSVTIGVSGSTYTITGSVTTDTGDTATFSYEGPLTGSY